MILLLSQIEDKSSIVHYDNLSHKNDSSSPHSDGRPSPGTSSCHTASISDFSPDWAYPEGGVKVLVTGPWNSASSSYTVLFDTFPVPTTLVQSGVLRCYCPGK